VLKGYIFLCS